MPNANDNSRGDAQAVGNSQQKHGDLQGQATAPRMKAPLQWLWLAVVVIILDLGSKWLALFALNYDQPVTVIPGFFNLTLMYNHGAAFSFLADNSGWQRWLLAAIAIIAALLLGFWLTRLKAGQARMAAALALIIGGAIGNLFDRMVNGYVVDFLSFHWQQVYYYPTFNIADSAITIGAVLLILDSFTGKKVKR
ncbi:Lipoprotein signal peptidase [Halomonadaceae bacterium LMG 33818]|uniref:signal peptidase II n=1 Tax=Cernens ardua TaxID=3402176 RepID=UPI003EDBC08F